MSEQSEIQQLKQKIAEFTATWQKKLAYLKACITRLGWPGFSYWLKSHHQIDQLNEALSELVHLSENDEDFQLLQVETVFNCFILPEEDSGQAEWYRFAHEYLMDFHQKLSENGQFDIAKLQSAQKEMRFICQADEFHQRYGISSIQEKVSAVYHQIEQAINDFKAIENEKQQEKQKTSDLEKARLRAAKADAEAKKAMYESVKIKEKRIAIMEEKKKRIAERELVEAQEKKDIQDAELKAKQAEIDRQFKLQESYVELQVEEKIASWDVNDMILKMTQKLQDPLDAEQTKAVESFISFLKTKV